MGSGKPQETPCFPPRTENASLTSDCTSYKRSNCLRERRVPEFEAPENKLARGALLCEGLGVPCGPVGRSWAAAAGRSGGSPTESSHLASNAGSLADHRRAWDAHRAQGRAPLGVWFPQDQGVCGRREITHHKRLLEILQSLCPRVGTREWDSEHRTPAPRRSMPQGKEATHADTRRERTGCVPST